MLKQNTVFAVLCYHYITSPNKTGYYSWRMLYLWANHACA